MKTGEIWKNDDMLILLGKNKPNDIWEVAPFGPNLNSLEQEIIHIRSEKNWSYYDISGNEIRKLYHKIYEGEL